MFKIISQITKAIQRGEVILAWYGASGLLTNYGLRSYVPSLHLPSSSLLGNRICYFTTETTVRVWRV